MTLSLIFICRELSKLCHRRYDGSPALPYWRARDVGIEEEHFSFLSGKNTLSGSRYFLEGENPKAVVIFFHGLGDGRASYIKEISLLVKQGYLVYAYDNTGSMESEGKTMISFDHTLEDQKAFFHFLDKDPKANGLRRFSIGHSWGGFGALASAKKEYHVEKIVSLAGYTNIMTNFLSHLPKWMCFLRPLIWISARFFDPRNGGANSLKILKKSDAKVLYIQGDQDKIVLPKAGFISLRKAFYGNPRFKFIYVQGSGHSVFRDPRSEEYVHSLLKQGIEEPNCDSSLQMDLNKATEENKEVWKAIFEFFDD